MLELYHCDPNANSGKPMMALHEKGVPFVSHYVDLPNFGAHDPEFLKINPEGKAPVLIHDGRVITESTQMCEYIDEAFEGPPLRIRANGGACAGGAATWTATSGRPSA